MHWLPYYIDISSNTMLPAFNRASSFSYDIACTEKLYSWLMPTVYDRFQLANRALQFSTPKSLEHLLPLWKTPDLCVLRLYCMAAQFLQTKHAHANRANIEKWYEYLDQVTIELFNNRTVLGKLRSNSSHQSLYTLADVVDPVPYYVRYNGFSKKFSLLTCSTSDMYLELDDVSGHARRVSFLRNEHGLRFRAYSQIHWTVKNHHYTFLGEDDIDDLTDAILGHEWTLLSKYISIEWSADDQGVAVVECLKNLYHKPKYFFRSSNLFELLSSLLSISVDVLKPKIDVLFTMSLTSTVIWNILKESSSVTNCIAIDF